MKRTLLTAFGIIILAVLPFVCSADDKADSVRAAVAADRMYAAGLDRIYDAPAEKASAPEGWECFYVSHYGRHGSRYAYTGAAYTSFMEVLRKGAADGNLTSYGQETLDSLEQLYPKVRYRVGNLTRKGWNQHISIARNMVQGNPSAFGEGSRIDAVPSNSPRAIVSMGAFCLEAGRQAPQAEVYEHQGLYELQATSPNMGENPLVLTGAETVNPYPVSVSEMFLSVLPDYLTVLGRFFTLPGKVSSYIAVDGADEADVMFWLFDCMYMLEAGQYSLDFEWTVPQIFTDGEFARMWEADNYSRFDEYIRYKTPCCSVWLDFVDKADGRIASGERGADLRFGHDHVLMTLLMLADIDGFDEFPAKAEDLPGVFRTYKSPMAGNIQLLFYRPVGSASAEAGPFGSPVKVRLLLNEAPAAFPSLRTDADGCYLWSDVRTYLLGRISRYVQLPR